jgi:hypothetical protein
MEDIEAISWKNAHDEDLWVFDKLILSRRLGYVCGPAGMNVPKLGTYIVRPCVNIPGMGKGAQFYALQHLTDELPPGTFWCEMFTGRHISVDYRDGEQVLAVEGFRESNSLMNTELWRFSKWEKVDDTIPMPDLFLPLIKKYEYINIEYIDGKPIEVHFRHNPDFVWGNSIAIPIWKDGFYIPQEDEYYNENGMSKLRMVKAPDQKRWGFFIDN